MLAHICMQGVGCSENMNSLCYKVILLYAAHARCFNYRVSLTIDTD